MKLITVGSERVKPGGLDLSLGPLYWQFPTYMFQCDKGLLVSWQVDDVFERWPGDRTPCGLSRVIRPRPCQQICECAVAISGIIITSPDAATRTGLKPWLNGTPSSSQLEPSYRIKTCIGGWPNGTAKSSLLALKPFNCLKTTA